MATPHNITTTGLKRDPSGRFKVVDGKETAEVMKLCGACYASSNEKKHKPSKR